MVNRIVIIILLLCSLCPAAASTAPSPITGHYGPLVTPTGVSFRVWAPNAAAVTIPGSFNGWNTTADPLAPDSAATNYWSVFVPDASAGNEYKFHVNGSLWKPDPWSRGQGNNDNSIIRNPVYAWSPFTRPDFDNLVVYELHVGTFNGGSFGDVAEKAHYLQQLGISAVELMPPAEFNGSRSWGYNPAGPYAPEAAYGGYEECRQMIDTLHQYGISVIIDVVYNHIEGTILWKWDGWTRGSHQCTIDGETAEHGGIFYYSWEGAPAERWYTPWGKSRPNYLRAEVTNYITENALFWLNEMNCDGLRWDSTYFMRLVEGTTPIPETQPFLRAVNERMDAGEPDAVMIAEDRANRADITDKSSSGFGYDSQWNDYFVDHVRDEMIKTSDASRNMDNLKNSIVYVDHNRPGANVKFTESHDDDANGSQRLNSEIDNLDGTSYDAKKRSTLGAAIALTAPGIPMLFMGQEFLMNGYFSDEIPLDWSRANTYGGILRLYRDMIHLRRDLYGVSAGLKGDNVNVYHVNNTDKVMAYHRYQNGGAGDDVIIIVNNSSSTKSNYAIGMPREGVWYCLCDSDWQVYDAGFANLGRQEITATTGGLHGLPYKASFDIPPYSFLVYSQAPPPVPEAWFTAAPTNGNTGVPVRFFDETDGTGTNWFWQFGDGGVSAAVNPTHAYQAGGTYSISLTVAGPSGESTVTRTNYITVIETTWIDGQNITTDFADADTSGFQDTVTDWAEWNSLMGIYGSLLPDRVLLGVSGSIETAAGNGWVVFFDTDPSAGTNVIPANLSGVSSRVQNMAGMHFDADFTPEHALVIALSASEPVAWVDYSDLVTDENDYWGELQNLDTSYGYISNSVAQLGFYNQYPAGTDLAVTGTFDTGMELSVQLSALGGEGTMCRIQTIIINGDGSWSADQSLLPIHNDTNLYAVSGLSSTKRYNLVAGPQNILLGIPEPGVLFPAAAWLLLCLGRGKIYHRAHRKHRR